MLETSTVLGSSRRYLSFHVHGQRSPTLECISVLENARIRFLEIPSAPSSPFSRMDNREAWANRDKFGLCRIISEGGNNREDDAISWVGNDTRSLNRGKFGLCRITSEMRLRRIEKRMVLELEMTYKNVARDLEVTRRNVKRKSSVSLINLESFEKWNVVES